MGRFLLNYFSSDQHTVKSTVFFSPTSHLTMVFLFTRFQLKLSFLQNTVFLKNALHLPISVSSHSFSNVWFLPILQSAMHKSTPTPPREASLTILTKLTSLSPVTILNLFYFQFNTSI